MSKDTERDEMMNWWKLMWKRTHTIDDDVMTMIFHLFSPSYAGGLRATMHTPFSLWIKNYEFEKRVRDMKFMNFFRLRSSLESNDYQVPGVCHTSDDGSCDWPVRGNRGIRRRVVFCVLCIFLETCRVSSNLSNLTTTIYFQCFCFCFSMTFNTYPMYTCGRL